MPMERLVSVTGTLAPFDQAEVRMKVSGRLESFAVDLGSIVKEGDIIARVEAADFELRVQQAEAALAQTEARLGLQSGQTEADVDVEQTATVKQASAMLEEARLRRQRVEALFKQGIISKADLDTADAEYRVADARSQEAREEILNRRAQLAQRRSELAIARQDLKDTIIRAPFQGAIQERIANLGEVLQEGAPVVRLVRVDPLRLRVAVPETQAAAIRSGQPVRVNVDGDPKPHIATVKRISPAISDEGRVLMVEAEVRNPGTLRPGSFARADIVVEKGEPALSVPSSSVISFAGIDKVMVVEEGAATERVVSLGRTQAGLVEVLNGLRAGELVARDPNQVRPGERVEPTLE